MPSYINSLNNSSSNFEVTSGTLTVDSLAASSTTGVITVTTAGVFSEVDTGAAGTIFVGTATGNPKFLTAGTSGYVLTSAGSGADASWLPTLPGGINWTRETAASVPAVENHGYINTNVGLTTITLPATAALGTILAIMGESAAGWKIAQNAGQSIQVGALTSTPGVTGYIASTNQYDVVYLVCRVTDTTWSVVQSMGNILIA